MCDPQCTSDKKIMHGSKVLWLSLQARLRFTSGCVYTNEILSESFYSTSLGWSAWINDSRTSTYTVQTYTWNASADLWQNSLANTMNGNLNKTFLLSHGVKAKLCISDRQLFECRRIERQAQYVLTKPSTCERLRLREQRRKVRDRQTWTIRQKKSEFRKVKKAKCAKSSLPCHVLLTRVSFQIHSFFYFLENLCVD